MAIDNRGDGGTSAQRPNPKKPRVGGFVNGEFYGFARLSLSLAGEAIVAFKQVTYSEEIALEPIYGASPRPVSLAVGNYLATVSLEVFREDFDFVIRKKIGSLMNQKPFEMALVYAKRAGAATVTDRFSEVHVEKISHSAGAGESGLTVNLECKCLGGIIRL
jgi:hypothetical protein